MCSKAPGKENALHFVGKLRSQCGWNKQVKVGGERGRGRQGPGHGGRTRSVLPNVLGHHYQVWGGWKSHPGHWLKDILQGSGRREIHLEAFVTLGNMLLRLQLGHSQWIWEVIRLWMFCEGGDSFLMIRCGWERTSPMAQWVKNLPSKQETQEMQVRFLGQEDPLEKEMATHSNILAWKIPRTEESGRLQAMGPQRVPTKHKWERKRGVGNNSRNLPGGPVATFVLPMQGSQVQSLFRELASSCLN